MSHGFPLFTFGVVLLTRTVTGIDADFCVAPEFAIVFAPLSRNCRIGTDTNPRHRRRRALSGDVDGHHGAVALVLAELRGGAVSTVFVAPLVGHDVNDACVCDADACALPPWPNRMATAKRHSDEHGSVREKTRT